MNGSCCERKSGGYFSSPPPLLIKKFTRDPLYQMFTIISYLSSRKTKKRVFSCVCMLHHSSSRRIWNWRFIKQARKVKLGSLGEKLFLPFRFFIFLSAFSLSKNFSHLHFSFLIGELSLPKILAPNSSDFGLRKRFSLEMLFFLPYTRFFFLT